MRYMFITVSAFLLAGSAPSYADNPEVENAIRSRPDLSTFYQAMINTGVNRELSPDISYTVFAPTNSAFAGIRQDQYPCFYLTACRAEVAQIIRNHIIPGNVYISDAVDQKGGLYTVNGRFVNIGEPNPKHYAVDGHDITYMSSVRNGMLYKIDGVIANPREMASLQGVTTQYVYPSGESTTIVERVVVDPTCEPSGCPRLISRTVVTQPVEATSMLSTPIPSAPAYATSR